MWSSVQESLNTQKSCTACQTSYDKGLGWESTVWTKADLFTVCVCVQNAFQERNENVIINTVKRLPLHVIPPLIKEVSQRMHGHPQR